MHMENGVGKTWAKCQYPGISKTALLPVTKEGTAT